MIKGMLRPRLQNADKASALSKASQVKLSNKDKNKDDNLLKTHALWTKWDFRLILFVARLLLLSTSATADTKSMPPFVNANGSLLLLISVSLLCLTLRVHAYPVAAAFQQQQQQSRFNRLSSLLQQAAAGVALSSAVDTSRFSISHPSAAGTALDAMFSAYMYQQRPVLAAQDMQQWLLLTQAQHQQDSAGSTISVTGDHLPVELQQLQLAHQPGEAHNPAAAAAAVFSTDVSSSPSGTSQRQLLVSARAARRAQAPLSSTSATLPFLELPSDFSPSNYQAAQGSSGSPTAESATKVSRSIHTRTSGSFPSSYYSAQGISAALGGSGSSQQDALSTITTGSQAAVGRDAKLPGLTTVTVEDVTSYSGPADSSNSSSGTGKFAAQPDYRIIGGTAAPMNRYKWICSLRTNSDFHFCGCSLIAPTVILTAAHCLSNNDAEYNTPWVEIGRYNLQGQNNTAGNDYDRLKCQKSVVFPGWTMNVGTNDIALCFLPSASRYTPVQIAKATTSIAENSVATVMGWGAEKEGGGNSDKLMQVDVLISSLSTCNATYGNKIRSTQLCAGLPEGDADACQGDSGGPLFIKGGKAGEDVQIGIVSYGVGCGRPRIPGVYTDVRKYWKFIARHMLINGVTYPPITGNDTASAATTGNSTSLGSGNSTTTTSSSLPQSTTNSNVAGSRQDACSCSQDGMSGGVNVGHAGCKQHGLMTDGDQSYYCYVQGGGACATAAVSDAFPGAAWSNCDPTTGVTTTAPSADTVTATSGLSSGVSQQSSGAGATSTGSSSLLSSAFQNFVGNLLFG